EEGRRADRTADRVAILRLLLDLLLVLAGVECRLELRHVEADLLRILLERRTVEGLLVGEELIVHLPELALLARGHRSLRGRHGLVVEGERIVLPDDAH